MSSHHLVEVELGPLMPGYRQAVFDDVGEAERAAAEVRSHVGSLCIPWGDIRAVRVIPLSPAQAEAWLSEESSNAPRP